MAQENMAPSASVPNTEKNAQEHDAKINGTDRGAQELAKTLTEDASKVAATLKTVAGDVATEAKKAADATMTSQKGRVVEGLGGVVGALRQVASGDQGSPQAELSPALRPYVDKVADQIETVSRYMQSRNITAIGHDIQAFARREPALFLGGAFALGLIGGRFLRASTPRSDVAGASSPTNGVTTKPSGAA